MKKILPILAIVLTVVVLGGCSLLQKKEAPAEGGVATQEESTGTKEESYSGTLKQMMTLGIPMKCTWKRDENYYGTSWVKGQKSYGEIYIQGRTVSVIFKDNCMWNWEEGNPQGFKMCFEPQEGEEEFNWSEMGGEAEGMQGAPPPDIDYNCRPAVITDAKFNPPGNVQFMTMEEMMQGGGGMMPQGEEMPEEMPEMPEIPEGWGQ